MNTKEVTMIEIQIEKGVPIPFGTSASSPITKALQTMEVGDSFCVPMSQPKVAGYCSSERKRSGRTFKTRKESDKVRVWRVS